MGFYTDRSGVNHGFTRDLKTGRITIIHRVTASLTATAIDDREEVAGYVETAPQA